MKPFRHYSVVFALLSLVLFHSFPVKSLHACNNLVHHHDCEAIEQDHADCLICDFQLSPADLSQTPNSGIGSFAYSQYSEVNSSEWNKFPVNTDYNKGPPSVF